MEGDIPKILNPLILRNSTKLRSLRRHAFTAAEKRWICHNLLTHCDDIAIDLLSAIRSFSMHYDLETKSVLEWISIYTNGEEF